MNRGKINPEVLDLVRQIPKVTEEFDPEHFCLFAQELFSQSDRAALIVGAANLDALLRKALNKYAAREKRRGSNLSTCIDLALIHGIVHKDVWEWLHDLRDLRNEFAHEVLPGFDLSDARFSERLVRLTQPGWPSTHYYAIAEACGWDRKASSAHQVNVRARIAAYCEILRRAIEGTRAMPIRWVQAR